MILAGMLHAIVVALILSGAAWTLEKAAALRGASRRYIWTLALAGSLIVPVMGLIDAEPVPVVRSAGTAPASWVASTEPLIERLTVTSSRDPNPDRDAVVLTIWFTVSSLLFLTWTVASACMARVLGRCPELEIAGRRVYVSDATGPGVLGYLRPRIIVPRAVLARSPREQALIIRHEAAHADAQDPLLLFVAMVLVFAAPWNPLLWWQWRRLRFAIEIDCDARVTRSGIDVDEYCELLLNVGTRGALLPTGAVMFVQQRSQLERRIRIMLNPIRRRASVWIGALVAIGAGAATFAATLDAPVIPTSGISVAIALPGRLGFEREGVGREAATALQSAFQDNSLEAAILANLESVLKTSRPRRSTTLFRISSLWSRIRTERA